MAATPHVHPAYPTTGASCATSGSRRCSEAARGAGLTIEIVPGGEIDLEYAASYDDDRSARGRSAAGRRCWSSSRGGPTWPLALAPTCRDLRMRGFLPIVAHPERARPVQQRPERLDDVIASGAVCQITNGSLAGRFGETAQRTAFALLRERRGHLIASDAHGAASRGPSFAAARKALADELGPDYADAIEAAAATVYEGRAPQLPRPAEPRRRGLFRR